MIRLIVVALALAAIGLLLLKELDTGSLMPSGRDAGADNAAPPAVPTRPQDLKTFGRDLNQFIGNAAERQRREIDRAAGE